MKQFASFVCLLTATVLVPSSAYAQEVAYVAPQDELAEAMIIMEAMFPVETREQTMLDLIATMGNQMGLAAMQGPVFEEPGIRAIMDEFIAELPSLMKPHIVKYLPQMIDATAIAYTREFTLEELQDISAFATTPSGKRYFAKLPTVMNDPIVATANQRFFQDVANIQTDQAAKVSAKVQAYLEANPDVLERLKESGALGRE